MAINKVIYGGNTLIDLTDTTALANKVLDGFYFYGRDPKSFCPSRASPNCSSVISQRWAFTTSVTASMTSM